MLAQLLTVPIFVVGVGIYIGSSICLDQVQQRAVFMLAGALTLTAGYALLLGLSMAQKAGLYFAPFLVMPGLYVSGDPADLAVLTC